MIDYIYAIIQDYTDKYNARGAYYKSEDKINLRNQSEVIAIEKHQDEKRISIAFLQVKWFVPFTKLTELELLIPHFIKEAELSLERYRKYRGLQNLFSKEKISFWRNQPLYEEHYFIELGYDQKSFYIDFLPEGVYLYGSIPKEIIPYEKYDSNEMLSRVLEWGKNV